MIDWREADRRTGWPIENVTEPTRPEAHAMQAWLEAIDWATGDDLLRAEMHRFLGGHRYEGDVE